MASTTYEPPDYADWLRKLDQVIARMSTSDVVTYSIAGMTFTKRGLSEVMNHRERVLALYNNELAGGNVTLADMSGI